MALADAFSMTPYETNSTYSANQQEHQLKLATRFRSGTTPLIGGAINSARTLGKGDRQNMGNMIVDIEIVTENIDKTISSVISE